jgi:uncharacterized membrane protein
MRTIILPPLICALWVARVNFPHTPADLEQIILRWIHLTAGISWVGLLYVFNLVNVPFLKSLDPASRGKVIPLLMPRALWWFRWSAVLAVLAGFRYFMILVKIDGRNSGIPGLMGRSLGGWFAIWTMAWALQYLLLKFARGPLSDGRLLAFPLAAIIIAATWAVLQWMSYPGAGNRTLCISVGGGMGLFMLLNVWGVIWRCQKRIIAWTKANAEQGTPIPAEAAQLARLAFLNSRMNFWLSFPMLFFMAASAHYPFLSGQ